MEDATYRVPGRAMRMKLTITNNGNTAVRLGEFYTASVRFLDSDVYKDTTGYPEDLLAEDGLAVSDNSRWRRVETRTVEVTAADAAWEVYRLSDIIYDPDSRFAGLLFFFDNSRQPHDQPDRRSADPVLHVSPRAGSPPRPQEAPEAPLSKMRGFFFMKKDRCRCQNRYDSGLEGLSPHLLATESGAAKRLLFLF